MLDNQVAGAVGRQGIDKRFIDFQYIDVQRIEVVQVGIAGTKIIDRHFITRLTKRLNYRRRFRHVDKPTLGHFNFDLLRPDIVVAGFIGDHRNQA